jgi:Flp pilus assembly protein protease CpaA
MSANHIILALPVIALSGYAAFTDLKRREIDHWVPIAIAIYGTLYQLLYARRLPEALICTAAVFAILFAVFAVSNGGFGGGDVKLLTSLALFYGSNIFVVVFASCIIGAIYGIIQTIITKRGLKTESPFAPAVFLSVFLAAIFL